MKACATTVIGLGAFRGDFMVGCTMIRVARLKIFDLGDWLPWYLIVSVGFGDFLKSDDIGHIFDSGYK